jgi:poly-gamma-glutamate capsule biosynthesis protein CapA/YwtB (metallophosphatase superfamily)
MKSYKDKDKQLLIGLLFLSLVAGLTGRFFETEHFTFPKANSLNSAAALLATQQNIVGTKQNTPVTVSLGFGGDIMLDRGVKTKVQKNLGGDYNALFANAGLLKDPDISFANLEGPVSDVGTDKHNLYSFRMAPETIPALKAAGIDVVSSANNHIGDWGYDAMVDTIKRLRAADIATCGIGMNKADAVTPAIFSKDGYTVGYLCFTDVGPNDMAATATTAGILLASDPDFDTIVRDAAKKVDALIVSFHFGVEYENLHNERQELLATKAVDDGAVMVVGAHPHVPEDIALHTNGAPRAYSLGNFIFDQPFSKETLHGIWLTADLTGKTITNLVSHKTTLDKNYAPSIEK